MKLIRNTRLIIALCVFSGVSLATIIGTVTGFFAMVANFVSQTYENFTTFFAEPFDWSQLATMGEFMLAPLIAIGVLVAVFAMIIDS